MKSDLGHMSPMNQGLAEQLQTMRTSGRQKEGFGESPSLHSII